MDVQRKSAHALEQERPDILKRRQDWFEGQPDLDPRRLVFIDETGLSTKMARLRGRAPRGERCRAGVPHGHWKTTNFTGALRLSGMTAPFVYDGAMNGTVFRAYVEQVLAPTLIPGDVVIMDNLPAHKAAGVRESIKGGRSRTAVPPALQPGLQPHRECIRQAQGAPARQGRAHHQRPLGRCRIAPQRFHATGARRRIVRIAASKGL
jgi:hypothetical protein